MHSEIGFNLRFNEIQAAVGRVLLRRLDAMNDRRRALAARYDHAPGGAAARACRPSGPGARHVYHLYVVRTPRRAELAALSEDRAASRPASTTRCRATGSPRSERFAAPPLPETERLVDEILTLPISAGHTEDEIDTVAAAVREFFGA